MGKSLIDKLRKGVRNTILLGAALASIGFASCQFPGPSPPIPPPTQSSIDFTSVENTYLNPDSTSSYGLNEGQQNYSVPLPTTDINGKPVTYSGAQGDSNVTASISGSNLVLSENNPISADTNYSVKVSYNDNGTSSSTTLTGKLFDLPDILGQLQSNEDHQPYAGILEISYTDTSGNHSVNNSNSTLSGCTWDSNNLGNSIIDTDNNGNFNIRINERTDNITGMTLKAGIGSYTTTPPANSGFSTYSGPSGSFTRVLTTNQTNPYGGGLPPIQTLTVGDNNLTGNNSIRATPLTTLLNNGVSNATVTTSQAFQTFFNAAEGDYLNKYNIPKVEIAFSYNNGNNNITYFNSTQQNIAASDAQTLSNLISSGITPTGISIPNLRLGLSKIQIDPSDFPQNINKPDWEVVIPADNSSTGGYLGFTNTAGGGGTFSTLCSYIISTLSSPTFDYVTLHEIAHGLIEPMDISGYPTESIFDGNTILTSPSTTIDRKAILIVYEETYKAIENINNYILKVGF